MYLCVYLCGLLASPAFIWFKGFMMGAADWLGPTQADRRTDSRWTDKPAQYRTPFPIIHLSFTSRLQRGVCVRTCEQINLVWSRSQDLFHTCSSGSRGPSGCAFIRPISRNQRCVTFT